MKHGARDRVCAGGGGRGVMAELYSTARIRAGGLGLG